MKSEDSVLSMVAARNFSLGRGGGGGQPENFLTSLRSYTLKIRKVLRSGMYCRVILFRITVLIPSSGLGVQEISNATQFEKIFNNRPKLFGEEYIFKKNIKLLLLTFGRFLLFSFPPQNQQSR
jgi:hypothetical protein